MRFVSASEMRELDRRAVHEHGIPGVALMRKAGRGVAEAVRRLGRATDTADLPVLMVAGRGNNGGDVFAAAAELLRWGFRVRVRLVTDPRSVTGDARVFLDALPAGIVEVLSQPGEWDADDPGFVPHGTLFVDGVLGTGAKGAPRGTAAAAIRWLRRAASVGRIVAVDLPSGLDADTGVCHDPHVVADLTVCLALPKKGLRSPEALAACGRVEIADIGFPQELTGPEDTDGLGWIGEAEVRSLVPPRPRDAHKGTFGHALVVGGSQGFSGAASMAATGALRAGAGLATIITPRSVASAIASQIPEAMVQAIGSEYTESLHLDAMGSDWSAVCASFETVVAGPGLSQRQGIAEVVDSVLEFQTRSIVLDADALNVLAGRAESLRAAKADVVLTPHPGEAGRLLGISASEVQADRPEALRRLVELTGATVILKGAGTLVGTPGRGVHMLLGGNPGMATGGSGDVLAGMVGGLLAQRMTPFDAARLAVWWHDAAGDLAAWKEAQITLEAGDIVRNLPETARWIMAR